MQTAGARCENFHIARASGCGSLPCGLHAVAQLSFILAQLFFLAKADLRRNIGPGHAQRAGFATAAFALQHVVAHQRLDRFHRVLLFHGAVARVVVQVASGPWLVGSRQGDAFFQQVFMDVHNAAAREYFVEFVALQLVVASAAADHHGLDVEVIQCVGHTVEQHPVVGDDLFGLLELPRSALRIAAAQIARRQHSLHTRMPEHGLRGQAHLAEQALRPAAGEIEHSFGFSRGGLGVADDGHIVPVFNVQQSPRCFLGQATGHLFVDEVDHLLFDGRGPHRGRRLVALLAGKGFEHIIRQALCLEPDVHHARAHELDGFGVGGIQEEHGRSIARTETLLTHLAQQVAHVHGHIAEVDLHRAGRGALVADGAVVGHILEFFPVLDADAPPGLLFVEESLDQQ